MNKDVVSHMRSSAQRLVRLARACNNDALSSELEEIAVELLRRAAELERS